MQKQKTAVLDALRLAFARRNDILNLHLKKSYTNLFFTLTDMKSRRVLYCVTSGMCSYGNKRRKVSTQTLEIMVSKLIAFLKLYSFKGVRVLVKCSLKTQLRTLVKEFNYHGFPIKAMLDVKKTAHNGVRARKMRRK